MENEEIWKEVDIDSRYEISTFGRVRTKEMILCGGNGNRTIKSHFIKTHYDSDGYLTMTRYEKSKNIKSHIHRMLAIAFIPNPNNLPQVNHKDGIKDHNFLNNLEWCTIRYNVQHSFNNGLGKTGESHHNSKFSSAILLKIKEEIKQGKTDSELGLKYNVHRSTIQRIRTNKTRKYE